jgi:hypothetical protein
MKVMVTVTSNTGVELFKGYSKVGSAMAAVDKAKALMDSWFTHADDKEAFAWHTISVRIDKE